MKLLNIFFPPRCAICGVLVDDRASICEYCRKILLHPVNGGCAVCGLSKSDCSCSGKKFFSQAAYPLHYENAVVKSLAKMKFYGKPELIYPFARLVADCLEEHGLVERTDIVTFVPKEPLAVFKRGYNQSFLLAKEVGRLISKPVLPLVHKAYKNGPQHFLGYIGRSGNILGVFEPKKRYLPYIEGKNILVVDDVITSGSTCNEIAKTLLIFSAQDVFSASVAATRKKQKKSLTTSQSK